MVEVQLMQGDCLELMCDIPDGSVDMVLCDLPYGTTRCAWDVPIPFEPLWAQYRRICKPNAAIVLLSQMPVAAALVNSNPKWFRYEWIYEKACPTGFLNANRMPMKAHENILVFYRSLPTYNPQFTFEKPYRKKRTGGKQSEVYGRRLSGITTDAIDGKRYPRDVLRFSNSSCGVDKGAHPTQKPVALLEYLIKTYTNPGDTVLDNCMGSGSTGVACANTGRDFIGIELDTGYFETAKHRIEEANAQIRL